MSLNVAIVGSGPAGFYTAEALLKGEGAEVRIDIIDRLAAPFGLIRAGVAPDHQTTKRVAEAFERTALRDEVRYFGNVEVGGKVSLDELREIYDAVVLAVGAPFDHAMNIPGEDKRGVYGSAAFVGWYNGHPDLMSLDPDLDTEAVAVIGVGNVAIDVARVLVKTPQEMTSADLPDHAARAIQAAPITDVYVIGRRGPVEAKFTNVELREMGKLETCDPVVDPAQLPDTIGDGLDDRDARLKARNLETLHEFAERGPGQKAKRVHFVFYASPVEVLGGDRVEGLRLERTRLEDGRAVGTGDYFEIDCGLVVPSIGYRSVAVEGAPFDERACIVPNDDGRVAEGLYAVGWIKRGPSGVIASNRPDGVAVAAHIRADLGAGAKPGREALEKLLAERQVRVVSYADWQKIDAAEVAAATPPAPRRKFVTLKDMLAVLDG
ncbi:MAG: FAD-dependent oxidoreductase [Rhodospirillales bacterium]|nr:FAD-dependent oxidoreductase [Rhodospirillales bacterium]